MPRKPPAGPYRTDETAQPAATAEREETRDDRDLLIVYALMWLIGVGDVASSALSRSFGARSAFSVVVVVALPWLLRRTLRGLFR
jgi:hypothetical protein